MPEANEDYGDDEPSGALTGASGALTGASGESTGESSGALTGASGALTDESMDHASLGPIPGIIAPPSTIMPTSVIRGGPVARFALPPSATPPTSSPPSDDDDLDLATMADAATPAAFIARAIAASVIRAAGPEHAGYNPRRLNETVSSMINPVHMDAVDPEDALIRRMGCTNYEQARTYFRELLNSFRTTMGHNNQAALRRMLRRLNRILNQHRQVYTRNGRNRTTIRYSREIRNIIQTFGCRTSRARRILHAFLNELRQRIRDRLRETRSRRQAPSTAALKPDSRQGGKNRSKSHKTQRCKSSKRSKSYKKTKH